MPIETVEISRYKPNYLTKWAIEHGIRQFSISSEEITKRSPKRIPEEMINKFEEKMSMRIREHIDKFGLPPVWVGTYANRYKRNEPMLTPHRNKKKTGYILVERNNSANPDFEVFKSGGILVNQDDPVYNDLNKQDVRYVEKEFFRSRANRLLAYRFMNKDGVVVQAISARWNRDDSIKTIRTEQFHSDDWIVTHKTLTDLDVEKKEFDRLVLSL